MSDNWSVIREEVHTFRNYVKRLPPKAEEKAHFCYLLKKEEIDRLLNLKGDGTQLDGVRMYIGGNMIDGHLVPTVHVVVCEKDGDQYNDYNVPSSLPHDVAMAAETGLAPMALKAATSSSDGGSGGSTGGTAPCPATCSGTNILNS